MGTTPLGKGRVYFVGAMVTTLFWITMIPISFSLGFQNPSIVGIELVMPWDVIASCVFLGKWFQSGVYPLNELMSRTVLSLPLRQVINRVAYNVVLSGTLVGSVFGLLRGDLYQATAFGLVLAWMLVAPHIQKERWRRYLGD